MWKSFKYAEIYQSLGIVVFKDFQHIIAQVPLHNFQTFAPERVEDLVVISESNPRRYKFYAYDVPFFIGDDFIKHWASWLTHRDLRSLKMDSSGYENDLIGALAMSKHIQDVDHRDALVDAWLSWLQTENPFGHLDVARLKRLNFFYSMWTDRLVDLKCALILHHDARSVTMEDDENSELFSYDTSICTRVREMALISFARPDRKPKDPLQLSDDEFCNEYHSHSQNGQPCYKTKRLPEQL